MSLNAPSSERILEDVGISVNKNTVPGDKSALNPSGIRFGTPPLTTRGFREADMERVVALIVRTLDVAIDVQGRIGEDHLLSDLRRSNQCILELLSGPKSNQNETL